jgi:hypothetical protein
MEGIRGTGNIHPLELTLLLSGGPGIERGPALRACQIAGAVIRKHKHVRLWQGGRSWRICAAFSSGKNGFQLGKLFASRGPAGEVAGRNMRAVDLTAILKGPFQDTFADLRRHVGIPDVLCRCFAGPADTQRLPSWTTKIELPSKPHTSAGTRTRHFSLEQLVGHKWGEA